MAEVRLVAEEWPAAIYAIGDVHGCLDALIELEARIAADAAAVAGEKWLVTLGDHIDRGPASAGVVQHLLQPLPDGFRRMALRGNHEQMMLDFLRDPSSVMWLEQGGVETLLSYGINPGPAHRMGAAAVDTRAAIPPTHLAFLEALPLMLSLPGWIFVHAGIRPGVPLEQQSAEDMMWIREPFLSGSGLPGVRVVHGHTPTRGPVVRADRIGIDTKCYATGRLTALRVAPDGGTRLLST